MTEHIVGVGRRNRPEHETEVELAIVETQGDVVTLRLDDGEELELSAVELRAAMDRAA